MMVGLVQIGECFGISESILYGKQHKYTEFMDTMKKGRAWQLNQAANGPTIFDDMQFRVAEFSE
jgi:hypothetical protein|tara:strand:+ start:877 stop:1068 length:192 start_codon:yes stop_codon:yes gene_type:complete